ncbi:MAG: flippase-like domain-containing protein [Deltaproteobacteria bacterium]|nr:flippase-like domain-containing protein [Deltaproteobacteria bacterium]
MSENLRKKITKLIRIGISLGLLIWLFSRFDLQGVWRAFERLPLSLWIGACGILLLAQILSSFRWWIISKALKFKGAWQTYMGYYFVGMFFNLFLPTGIGGDIFKVHFLSRGIGRKLAATLTVLGDRFFGLAAMVLIGAFFVLIRPGLLPKPFDDGLVISGGVVVLILVGMPFIYNILRRMNLKILNTLPDSVLLLHKPGTFFPILGFSFCLQALGMGAVALMGEGMHIHVPPAFYFMALPIVNIMTMIPVTFNGIGLREGAMVYFLGLKGIEPEPALALGLLFFSIQVTTSLVGGVAYALGFHRQPAHEPPP